MAKRGQIALEFIVMYAIIVIVFILMFGVITTQRAAQLNQQQYSLLQLQATTIAGYINQALSAGPGYSTTVPLVGGPESNQYNVSMSTTGVIILSTKIGKQVLDAYAFSAARQMVVNGSLTSSANGISVYLLQSYTGKIKITNYGGYIYVDEAPVETTQLLGSVVMTGAQEGYAARFNGMNSAINSSMISLPSAPITLSVWVYWGGLTNNEQCIFNNGKRGANGYGMCLDSSGNPSNTITVNLNDVSYQALQTNVNLATGRWVNLIETETSGCLWNLYVNGTDLASGTVCGIAPSGGSAWIGNFGGFSIFNGLITNVQVYNSPLTQNQITQLYNQGIFSPPVSSNSIVGWWPLNGNAYDYSGQGNDGQTTNVVFTGIASSAFALKTNGGTPAANAVIGLASNYGTFNGNSVAVALANQTGTAKAIISFNKSATMELYGYNGNASVTSNIVAWWPLMLGKANAANTTMVPITLTNTQPSNTQTNFQQMITFNAMMYQSIEASDLGNIRFYSGQKELYSWCESGCTSTSTNSIFWVNMGSATIGGNNGIQVVNMTFLPATTEYDGFYAGEAPQLSTNYAEYDNGANVFGFYDNFAGTTLNTNKWAVGIKQNNNYYVSNELVITGGTGGSVSDMAFTTLKTFTYPVYSEAYITSFGSTGGAPVLGVGEATTNIFLSGDYAFNNGYYAGTTGSTSTAIGEQGGAHTNGVNIAYPMIVSFAWMNTGNEIAYFSYGSKLTSTDTSVTIGNIYLDLIAAGGSQSSSGTYQWYRSRAIPPDNIMPSVQLGNVISTPITVLNVYGSNPQNAITLNAQQRQNLAAFTSALFVGSNIPKVIGQPINHVYITLTNGQSTATPSGFQQMIYFNPSLSSYSGYEASDLGNIRFYLGNGAPTTELYSWCESGCTSTSTNAVFWVSIPVAMSASGGTQVLNMTFLKTSVEYDGNYAGEAPQLSPKYAEYDNGASVFPSFYQDFAGTATPSGWVSGGAGVINDGLMLNGASLHYAYTTATTYGQNSNMILDYYAQVPILGSCDNFGTVGFGYESLNPGNPPAVQNAVIWGTEGCAGVQTLDPEVANGGGRTGSGAQLATGNYVLSVYWDSNTVYGFYHNYQLESVSLPQGDFPPITTGIGGMVIYTSNTLVVNYVRLRDYLPNDAQPSFSFGTASQSSASGYAITINSKPPLGESTSNALYIYGSKSYIPITISNSGQTLTQTGFQQMVYFNPSASSYSQFMAPDLGNIRFYAGQTELYSWCESGCTSSSTNAIFWVNLGSTIVPAYPSQITINATLLPKTTEYDGNYAGEAPQLSPNYAEYDNGAKIFSTYDNFKGTSLDSNWGETQPLGGTFYVSNGLYFITNYKYYNLTSTAEYSPSIVEMEMYLTHPTSATFTNLNLGYAPTINSITYVPTSAYASHCECISSGTPPEDYFQVYRILNGVQNNLGSTTRPPYSANQIISFEWPSTGSQTALFNYSYGVQTSNTEFAWASSYIHMEMNPQAWTPVIVFYIRQRDYPPGGLMPYASVGSVVEPPASSTTSYSSNLANDQNLTAVAWVDYNGGSASNCGGVFGSGGQTTNGFQLIGYPGSGCGIFYVDSYNAPWPSGSSSLPVGKWAMLTGQYQSQSGQIYAYINGTLSSQYNIFSSGPATVNTVPSNGLYYIGNAAWSANGLDTFNGLVSNVQLYNRFLTASQIRSLYSAGPSGIPLQNQNLIGWWPLDGNANDSSGYGNNGSTGGTFVSSSYGIGSGDYLASFNGTSNVVIPNADAPSISGPFSVSFWFSSSQPYTSNFVSEIVDGDQPSGKSLNISICGGPARIGCPNGYGITTSVGTGTAFLGNGTYRMKFAANSIYDVTDVFSASGSTLYINGINESSFTYPAANPNLVGSSDYLQIGGSASGNALVGQLADMQVYNAVLTPAEAMQLYEQGLPSVVSVNVSG